jgi:poly-gamma-glutamate capsule biosynthesis protein CapA/YwtB (metallophosphatase superfamily)
MIRGRRALRLALLLLGGAAALVLGAEHLYYFPLTPLSLDTAGRTRLPRAVGELRLLFVGDILLADAATSVLARRGYDYPFAATRQLLGPPDTDLVIGNLEGPITDAARPHAGEKWSYRSPPEAARALARAGFQLMTLANNHVLDCDANGVRESIALLRGAGIEAIGAGSTPEEAHRPAVRDVRGLKVGILAYLPEQQLLDGAPWSLRHLAVGPHRAGTATATPQSLARDIAALRPRVDVVVVALHLGDRYQREPASFERDLCRRAIDAGADAVVGHGPHILGPVELYRGRPILYSIGNYAFGSGNVRARFSLMAFLSVEAAGRRLRRVELLPIYTVNRNPWVNFQTKVLVGVQARRVLRQLAEQSRPYGTTLAITNGRAVLDLPAR